MRLSSFLLLPFMLAFPLFSAAQDVADRYLKTIGEFAENFCAKVPMQGSRSSVEISGQAKAEVATL